MIIQYLFESAILKLWSTPFGYVSYAAGLMKTYKGTCGWDKKEVNNLKLRALHRLMLYCVMNGAGLCVYV